MRLRGAGAEMGPWEAGDQHVVGRAAGGIAHFLVACGLRGCGRIRPGTPAITADVCAAGCGNGAELSIFGGLSRYDPSIPLTHVPGYCRSAGLGVGLIRALGPIGTVW